MVRPRTDVVVLDFKTQFMQRAQRLVGAGYHWWCTGTVGPDRARALIRKFKDLYLIDLDHNARHARKRSKLGNAMLLLWQERRDGELTFVLVVTDGDHPARTLERLRDCRESGQRLNLTGYELVRQSRPGSSRAAWTWRMTESTYKAWRDRIRGCVRRADLERMRQAWHSIHKSPGFGGVRRQVRQLVRLFRAEWKRSQAGPFPMRAERHRYVQLLPMTGRLLRDVVRPTPDAPCNDVDSLLVTQSPVPNPTLSHHP